MNVIYKPAGRAAEYSEYACNFYTGCSNDCSYCYCKRGVMSHVWSNTPRLKKCFKNEQHALEVFEKELKANLPELQKSGLFFSFTTDPMLPETIRLTMQAVDICIGRRVPIKLLTKVDFDAKGSYFDGNFNYLFPGEEKNIAIGFTLTGHDELEPGASTNAERIAAMKKLHEDGFKTWASIEPIIDIVSAWEMVAQTAEFCDHYKVGVLSGGKRNYTAFELAEFVSGICRQIKWSTFYFKESFLSAAGISRYKILYPNCVGRDFNIFETSKNQ